jgi:hypothetical protein
MNKIKDIKKWAREHIGDGKLPNKYVVMSSNAEYIRQGNQLDWNEDKKWEGDYIGVYDTYNEALRAIDDKCHDVNATIEDRISGELFERYQSICKCCGHIEYGQREDTRFTNKKLGYNIKEGHINV